MEAIGFVAAGDYAKSPGPFFVRQRHCYSACLVGYSGEDGLDSFHRRSGSGVCAATGRQLVG